MVWAKILDIQSVAENSPASWYSDYRHNDNLNPTTFNNCMKIDADKVELFNIIFKDELKKPITIISDVMKENNKDSIDTMTQQSIA